MRASHELSGLMKWTTGENWRSHLAAVMAEHFESAMEAFGLTFAEMADALGGNWGSALWGCGFEDFLTRRFEPGAQNPVEDYLRRRGWKESVATRRHMTALQTSVMSLYEVSDIVPGQSLRARDLVRGGAPALVSERSGTQALKEWDRITARVVPRDDRTVLAGGMLPFTLEGSETLFARLRDQTVHPGPGRPGGPDQEGGLEGWHGTNDDLRRAAPLFTTAWLFDALPRALGTASPTLLNSDGDKVVFHTVNFPLARSATAEQVERRLNELRQFRQESPTFWNWLGEPPSGGAAAKGQKALMWNVMLDDGSVVMGTVELRGRMVSLNVNSGARAERGVPCSRQRWGIWSAPR